MSRLPEILDQMTAILNSLQAVMDEEQQQLSAGSVNGSLLQRITEDKSSLLTTLDYLEKQRRGEQDARRHVNDEGLSAHWQNITQKTQQLRDLNRHNGWLLEGQLARNQQVLEMLRPYQETGLYDKDGQATGQVRSGKKFSV